MNDEKFNALLIAIVQDVVAYIVKQDNVSEKEAAKSFYFSEVYESLEKENTKVWHMSTPTLYNLYKQEKAGDKITWPDCY